MGKKSRGQSVGCLGVVGFLAIAFVCCGGGTGLVIYMESQRHNGATAGGDGQAAGESYDVRVTSQIVKKVEGKHRYFFRIENHDSKPFEGEVEIKLLNGSGHATGEDSFNTTHPMQPEGGSNVHFDIRTGPVSVHGAEFGIRTFQYTVKSKGRIVNRGQGAISGQYEDLSR